MRVGAAVGVATRAFASRVRRRAVSLTGQYNSQVQEVQVGRLEIDNSARRFYYSTSSTTVVLSTRVTRKESKNKIDLMIVMMMYVMMMIGQMNKNTTERRDQDRQEGTEYRKYNTGTSIGGTSTVQVHYCIEVRVQYKYGG